MHRHSIWFLPSWRREILSSRSLRTTPISLPNKERTSYSSSIALSRSFINNILLCFNYTTGFSFIVDADDFGAELEGSACGGGREWFQEGHNSLAVEDAAGVEFGDARDGGCAMGGVEINYFLGCVLEC
jgi:hypothetical protein